MNQQAAPQTPLLVDARQAARLLGVSPRTLYSLLSEKAIPSVRLRGRRLFSPEALARWVQERLSADPPISRRRKDGQQDSPSAQRGKARGQQ